MRLASLKDGRDGRLVVVSRDLARSPRPCKRRSMTGKQCALPLRL
jgi:hypothetical protein